MKKRRTYAVVDIETTGTDAVKDRIIQFGCVLVEDGKIVSRFATDINPNQAIPKNIQNLTGITNAQVQKAPYFEDVALTIYNLLVDTIFVAHNIYFDYTFLSQELVRCGTPKLTNFGIDTVELAQVFLPTERSFRLGDLAESLGLIHTNPHQADSDAEVTAELLMLIESKMNRIPLITMKKIFFLSQQMAMDTGWYIKEIYQEMNEASPVLDSSVHIVSELALRKKTLRLFESDLYREEEFPKQRKKKEKLFTPVLNYRDEQGRMMNLVFKHFNKGEIKNLFIEAATGMGKTFGYLFPLSYFATPENPVIISTVSIMLQNQLLEKDIPLANLVSPMKLQATIVKSHRHYLDLQRFKETLEKPLQQKQYTMFQMRVLVWLLETQTGDLDELQLSNLSDVFWKDVLHRGVSFLSPNDSLYKEDFVCFLYKKMKQSNVLIVNHAFLVQESLRQQPLLPASSYLIIDEAHHLPDIASRISYYQINLFHLKKKVTQYNEANRLFDKMKKLFCKKKREERLLRIYCNALLDLIEELSDLFFEFSKLLKKNTDQLLVSKEVFDQLSDEGMCLVHKIDILLNDLLDIQVTLKELLIGQLVEFSISEKIFVTEFIQFFEEVKNLSRYFDCFTKDWDSRWVKEYEVTKQGQGLVSLNDLDASVLPETSWYSRYDHILYIGGVIKLAGNKAYLPEKLGIADYQVKSLPDPYDYERQARLYVPTESVEMTGSDTNELATYISSMVLKIAEHEKKPILVLFTSHEILSTSYYKINSVLSYVGREVLAQTISGSREKIMKRFLHSENAILLGADSFWEGVDLPGDALQMVIVTRLPFENPARPLIKVRYEHMKKQGIDPFTKEALPKAALRLRQALGRLIRSKEDKGVMVVLDRRLLTASYGKRMVKSLPKKLPIKEGNIEEIMSDIKEFF